MNILLIGNGFDLEHGLPTRYKDFLDFCRKVKQLYTTANKISKVQLLAEYENWKTDVSIKDILSFNYTSTYERIYDPQKSLKYNYIHGRANLENDVSLCNLVLGINEYLDDIRKDQDFEFLTFKKYYQRIYKGTDNYYLSWVEQIKNDYSNFGRNLHLNEIGHFGKAQFPSGERTIIPRGALSIQMHNLYIFGHSLTISDRDVLRTLILNDNVCTKIYYHRTGDSDKKALGELIRNLIRVIGQDELIRRTGGKKKTD